MLGFSNYCMSTYLHITHWVGNGYNDGAKADDLRSLASLPYLPAGRHPTGTGSWVMHRIRNTLGWQWVQ